MRPKATFASTVMCGNSAYDWNIMFTGRLYGGICARSSPSIRILPDVIVSRPASMRSSVDFPQPELPRSANSSPLRTLSSTLRTATVSPNFLTTSMIWTKFSARPSAPVCGR
ncbi:hypothetical protein DM47_601 [Burkholderia mallei]|nr:hypothetical protein DM50_1765 [Burkholderia mallei]KOT17719.1 hypothetical protein DM47_601 [Burkholderia mallei]